jgi:hypothetical protein
MANEVGEEHQAAGEDADDGDVSAVVVGGDLPGHLGDPSLNVVGRQQDFHVAHSKETREP